MKKLHMYLASRASSIETRLLDSGASAHITARRDWIKPLSFEPFRNPKKIKFGNSLFVYAYGHGQVVLCRTMDRKPIEITLSKVLYAPDFKLTLISCPMLDKASYKSRFGSAQGLVLYSRTNSKR